MLGLLYLQVLSQSPVGATLEDAQFDEDIDSQPPAGRQAGGAPAASKYEVVGTLEEPGAEKPDWISEVVPVRRSQLCMAIEKLASGCSCKE